MQVTRIVQAVALMLIVALAASCSASKEYSSKLFKPRIDTAKEIHSLASLRFLELDKLDADMENWVTTDIIMGRDTVNSTAALDKLAITFPPRKISGYDTLVARKEEKTILAKADNKPVVEKTTETTRPVVLPEQQIVKNTNDGTRNKKVRDEK